MEGSQQGVLEALKTSARARSAWIVPASHTAGCLAKLALVGPGDRLVVFADDAVARFTQQFSEQSLAFAADCTPEAFVQASHAMPVGEAREGTPASYAHAPGRAHGRLFWFVNSIGGRGLRVPDVRALSQEAARIGALLIVDNSLATSFGCHPLALGAHLVLEALDRVGQGRLSTQLVGVYVAPSFHKKGRLRLADPMAEEAYRLLTMRLGEPGSHACQVLEFDFATLAKGLESLADRMQTHMDGARAISEYVSCHPCVPAVFYPGLATHPDAHHAPTILEHGFGPALDVVLEDAVSAAHFLAHCSSTHVDKPAGGSWTRMHARDGKAGSVVRIVTGLEHPLIVCEAIEEALRSL
ncbi:PLP-dependent transferase [Collinsella sp. AGMB00827]|uniref:PLP-dependent transferase n=1 Tax=Collinsella ureilytica TaxID=2869515 RepID=A0ABS7MKX9_9ACTN|nr:PLP-dependent transferase [Collinsella urealyticum]MBY4797942.1 PLP-dependent transferase [Collinsella urealyticum]